MAGTNIAELKKKLLEVESRAKYAESLLNSFWTGDVPNGASLDHMILAKAGRERLERLRKTPALLSKSEI